MCADSKPHSTKSRGRLATAHNLPPKSNRVQWSDINRGVFVVEGPLTDNRPWNAAALYARNHQYRITCGPTGYVALHQRRNAPAPGMMPPAMVIPLYALRLRHVTAPKAALLVSCGACSPHGDAAGAGPGLPAGTGHGRAGAGTAAEMRSLRDKGWATIRVEWLGEL